MKRVLWVLILVGLVAALGLLSRRHGYEAANRTNEIILDYQSVLDLSRAQGGEDLFALYKSYGIASLAVPEWTLDDLELEGVVRVFNGLQLRSLSTAEFAPEPGHVYMVFERRNELEAIKRNLQLALGDRRAVEKPGNVLDVAIDLPTLRAMGLGFLPDRLNQLADAGWRLWLRPENKPIAATKILDNSVLGIKNVQGFIFGGLPNEAVGYPKELKVASDWIKGQGLKVGYVELDPTVQQKGIATVCKTHPESVVRVMAVVPLQQAKLPPETVVSMYSLGARERTLHALYVRPYAMPWRETGDLKATNEALLKGLVSELNDHGNWADFLKGTVGEASTFREASTRAGPAIHLAVGLVAMGVMAAVCLLLMELVPLRPWLAYGLIFLVAAGAGGWSFLGLTSTARAALALLSALVFPVLGFVVAIPLLQRAGRSGGFLSVWKGSLAITLGVTLISLTGALMASSVLWDTTYLLGLDLFRGVKLLSVGGPVVVVAFYLAKTGGREELLKAMNLDLKMWHVLGLGLLAAVGLFYVMRTGNVGGSGSSDPNDLERMLRRSLDAFLGVRPRFKEFVLGYPALMLAPFLIYVRWGRLVWLALLAAAIGQASLADTFAHTHTPIVASLLRTFIGLAVGCGLGTVACGALVLLATQLRKFLPAPFVGVLDANGNGATHAATHSVVQAGAP